MSLAAGISGKLSRLAVRSCHARPGLVDSRRRFPAPMFAAFVRRFSGRLALLCCLLAATSERVEAQATADWTKPFPPFRIAGNLYYVGSKSLASYLVTTPEGDILINPALEANVPMIEASMAQLGFKFADIRIIVISHAHWDHVAGAAQVKQRTGATLMVMDADVPVVESGGRADFHYGLFPPAQFPPVKVDRVLHDQDEVKLGGAVLVAHLTPGHTKGCTTWTMKVADGDRIEDAVIVGSPNVNGGYVLVHNRKYPQIADDYARMFAVLKALPCDLFLGAHGEYFGLEAKYAALKSGATHPFVDPAGYRRYVTEKEKAFRGELRKQEQAATPAK